MASLYAARCTGETPNVDVMRRRAVYHDSKFCNELADLAHECIVFTDNKLKESAIATGE